MSYVIVSGCETEKLYLTGIQRCRSIEFFRDGMGRIALKNRKKAEGLKDVQVVGNYMADIKKAKRFKTREDAEKEIEENAVLRYCKVEGAV